LISSGLAQPDYRRAWVGIDDEGLVLGEGGGSEYGGECEGCKGFHFNLSDGAFGDQE
jgi:hypothetical protein